jgi:pimeloyl-ACP methyl ester carboxylesterase
MCAVPPQGLMSAALGMMFSKPGLMKDMNNLMSGGKSSIETLREALFAQEVSLDDLKRYYKNSQSESHRAIWDMSLFGMPRTHRIKRTPLLVQGAEFDHLIPSSLVEMTARSYGVEAHIFPAMGHGLMLERTGRSRRGRSSTGWGRSKRDRHLSVAGLGRRHHVRRRREAHDEADGQGTGRQGHRHRRATA